MRGHERMEWFFATRVWRRMHGQGDGESGIDHDVAQADFEGIGTWILGRNMFGTVRAPWSDDAALQQAIVSAEGRDVRLGGDVSSCASTCARG